MKHERFLRPKDVAAELNCNVYTVYALLRSERLPGIKLHTHWRIKRADLDRFVGKTKINRRH